MTWNAAIAGISKKAKISWQGAVVPVGLGNRHRGDLAAGASPEGACFTLITYRRTSMSPGTWQKHPTCSFGGYQAASPSGTLAIAVLNNRRLLLQ
jgi:hypothetical protein